MVSVVSEYDEKEDRIKTEMAYDDQTDERLILKELEACIAFIAKVATMNGNLTPIEFLNCVAADIAEGNDIFRDAVITESRTEEDGKEEENKE